MEDLIQLRAFFEKSLLTFCPPLQVRKNEAMLFEVAGTKETMQGKQLVSGLYFASVIPKPKDVRFYFFPIYTNPEEFEWISPAMKKCLKGKSCFHFKKLDFELQNEFLKMISHGVLLYGEKGLI
ncbi:hypothetical protein [Algoriphagus marinus]|uniref:hypothetical protein n=1 Tax=Algoriphagus marinus TaxID=1925762 RepID=UPI00094BC0AA|nr:hypothetical protein [Algoriphagus marinus]